MFHIVANDEDHALGIVKIEDQLHERARRASTVMCRSINAQAEFWMTIGELAEANPGMTFNEIVQARLVEAKADPVVRAAA